MKKKNLILISAIALLAAFSCRPERTKKVYFIEPADMAEISGEFRVVMGVMGMDIEPAGAANEFKGHHHLIIDSEPVAEGAVVPADEKHLHFGKGQTQTDLKLTPGEHKLQLQFADGLHRSYGPAMSATITVKVK